MLEHTYESVDHISLHMYFTNRAKNTANYLAMNARARRIYRHGRVDDRVCQGQEPFEEAGLYLVRRMERLVPFQRRTDRKILDGNDGWPHAPRLLEDIYNFEDVLQVGCIINTFIRRADVVKLACIAQLVNVIAPIMTDPKGAAWRQTTYYPYYFASRFGRGVALDLQVRCPGYDAEAGDNIPYVDISGVHDEAGGTLTFLPSIAMPPRRSMSTSRCRASPAAR